MSAINELHSYLTNLGTLGTLTMGKMPATPDVIGTLYQYSGMPPERRFGVVGIGYEHPAIQVVFRGAAEDYSGPLARAYIARNALMAIQPGVLAGVSSSGVYLTIDPVQEPFPVAEVDVNLRHRIGFNVYVMKEPS